MTQPQKRDLEEKTDEHIVWAQDWDKRDRHGWSTSTEWYSLHATKKDVNTFIRESWRCIPRDQRDEYSQPDCTPRQVRVNEKIYNKVKASENGIWYRGPCFKELMSKYEEVSR